MFDWLKRTRAFLTVVSTGRVFPLKADKIRIYRASDRTTSDLVHKIDKRIKLCAMIGDNLVFSGYHKAAADIPKKEIVLRWDKELRTYRLDGFSLNDGDSVKNTLLYKKA